MKEYLVIIMRGTVHNWYLGTQGGMVESQDKARRYVTHRYATAEVTALKAKGYDSADIMEAPANV